MDTTPEKLAETIKELGVFYKIIFNSFVFTCPMCDGKEKLYIHKKKGFFKCFKCGDDNKFLGRVEYALQKLTNVPMNDLVEKLYGVKFQFDEVIKVDWQYDPFDYETLVTEEEPLPPAEIQHFPLTYVGYGRKDFLPGLQYLLKRGITVEQIQKHNINYDPKSKRVIFPVWYEKDLYGWQGRYVGDTTVRRADGEVAYVIPKALTTKTLNGGRFMMFTNNLESSDQVILCEGPVTALHCEFAPGCGAVASLGKQISKHQIDAIASHRGKKIYLALDPDAATMSEKVFNMFLERCPDKEIYFMQPTKHREDLGDCTPEEIVEAYEKSILLRRPFIFFYFKEN